MTDTRSVVLDGGVPNQPKTPVRGFRVPDELWHAAREKAEAEGTTISAVIQEYLRKYVNEQ